MASKRPPLEIDELTNNLKQSSGKGIDAFFASQSDDTNVKPLIHEDESTSPTPIPKINHEIRHSKPKSRHHDVKTSVHHDVKLRKWRDIIEGTETQNSSLRMTKNEKYDVKDLIEELERKYKVETSLNEIARLGILYIIEDFKKDKMKSLIMRVKKS
jgi:hypothetical protein